MRRQLVAALAAAAAGFAATTGADATAATATTQGFSVIEINPKATAALKRQSIEISATGTAEAEQGKIVLPATKTSFGRAAVVRHRGGLVVRRRSAGRTRSVRITGLRVELGKRRVVTGRIGGKRLPVLRLDLLKGEFTVDAKQRTVVVPATRAALTAQATRRIASRLRVKRLRTPRLAVLATRVGGADPALPGAAPAPVAPPSSSNAVNVTTSALTWRVRESFIRYMNTEAAPIATGGAVAAPPELVPPATTPLTYGYTFTPAGGWYDSASGQGRVLFTGSVRFVYASHGIDFEITNPEVELGAEPRVVATFIGRAATPFSGRAVLMDLDRATAASPVVSGGARSWPLVPGTVSPTGAAAFAGFYSAGEPFGGIAISLATD